MEEAERMVFKMAAIALILTLLGCTTMKVENLTITGSTVSVNMPKTITITPNTTVPTGALGL